MFISYAEDKPIIRNKKKEGILSTPSFSNVSNKFIVVFWKRVVVRRPVSVFIGLYLK